MGDVDIALRTAAQLRPADLIAPFVNDHIDIDSPRLEETQLARAELRLDKLVGFVVAATGERRLLHHEFQTTHDATIDLRVAQYRAAVALSEHGRDPDGDEVPIHSVVVSLSGPSDAQPGWVHVTRGWREHGDEGHRNAYWLEPVYNLDTASLLARPPFWRVFLPLARDATYGHVESALRTLGSAVDNRQQRADLTAAGVILADRVDTNWTAALIDALGVDIMEKSTLWERAEARGEAKAREEARTRLIEILARATDDSIESLRGLDLDALEERLEAVLADKRQEDDES